MGATKETGEFELLPAVRLYKGDRQRLQDYYPKAGYNKILRRLVHEHLAKLDAKFEQRAAAKGLATGNKITMEDDDE